MTSFAIILDADACGNNKANFQALLGEGLLLLACRFFRRQFKSPTVASLSPALCVLMTIGSSAQYLHTSRGAGSGAFSHIRSEILRNASQKLSDIPLSNEPSPSLFSALLKACCFFASCGCGSEVVVLRPRSACVQPPQVSQAIDVAASLALAGLVQAGAVVSVCGPDNDTAFGGRLLRICSSTGGLAAKECCQELLNFDPSTGTGQVEGKVKAQRNYVVDPAVGSEGEGEYSLCTRCFALSTQKDLSACTCGSVQDS